MLDVGFRQPPSKHVTPAPNSFNPCCAGCGFQTVRDTAGLPMTVSFNPCCAGCGFQTCRDHHVHVAGHQVSILVVLDVGFIHGGGGRRKGPRAGVFQTPYPKGHPNHPKSFNPCCAGCGFQTAKPGGKPTGGGCFNPCCAGCGFQTSRTPSIPPTRPSFNPCCAGCGFQTPQADRPAGGRHVSILVVLDVGFRR